MKLILVRHGDAVSSRENELRPLSRAGQDQVRTAGVALKEQAIHASRVLHSPLKRAVETAEILCAVTHVPDANRSVTRGLMPGDPAEIMQEFVRIFSIEHPKENLMLVGHLPYMSVFAAALLRKSEEDRDVQFETGTVLVLELGDDEKWNIVSKISP